MSTAKNTYNPDYIVIPGEILRETLEVRNIKNNEFAERCGLNPKTISLILSGNAPITAETALQFEKVLGVSAAIWTNLESAYRLYQAKVKEESSYTRYQDWVKSFPLAELKKFGILPNTKNISTITRSLLKFFGVSSPEAWNEVYNNIAISYRKSVKFKDSIEAITAWLRIGIIKAEEIETKPYDKNRFYENLLKIRNFTTSDPGKFEIEMKQLCADSGVVLVFVPELKGTHLSGATMWLSKDKALIIMSLRHKTDDHFWFTFFHEAGHILLHGKKEIFIDETEMDEIKEEMEANDFAGDILIPKKLYQDFVDSQRGTYYDYDILAFADKINITPGIVVGRLQHDNYLPYNYHNKLKKKFIIKK